MTIETPCIQVCVIDPVSGLCAGCRRTRAEIAAWSALTPTERRAIMDDLARRDPAATPAANPR
jgi:hypothetical protein